MLFLMLLACGETWVVTFVGGGSATATLSGLEGWSDVSVDVPGLSEDQLDDLFRDGHDPQDVGGRLTVLEQDEDLAVMILDPRVRDGVDFWAHRLSGFEPCGLSLAYLLLLIDLDSPSEWVDASGSPPAGDFGVHNVFYASENDVRLSNEAEVQDWNVDEYAGSTSVEVEVTCPEGTMTGLFELEWKFDPDVSRDAHTRVKENTVSNECMFCAG